MEENPILWDVSFSVPQGPSDAGSQTVISKVTALVDRPDIE